MSNPTRVAEMLAVGASDMNITLAALARKIGVSSQTLNNWKKRNSIPKDQAGRVAEVLQVPLHVVLGHAPNAVESRLKAVEWDDESELEHDTFLLAPLLEVELSAGGGRMLGEEIEQYKLPIRRYTLRKQGVSADDVRMVRVLGDSMEDKIADDSVVAIDTSDKLPRDGKIYAYSDCDLLKVKYLHPLPGGGLRIRSHNPDYPAEDLTPEAVADRIVIHGRVFMYSSLC